MNVRTAEISSTAEPDMPPGMNTHVFAPRTTCKRLASSHECMDCGNIFYSQTGHTANRTQNKRNPVKIYKKCLVEKETKHHRAIPHYSN